MYYAFSSSGRYEDRRPAQRAAERVGGDGAPCCGVLHQPHHRQGHRGPLAGAVLRRTLPQVLENPHRGDLHGPWVSLRDTGWAWGGEEQGAFFRGG